MAANPGASHYSSEIRELVKSKLNQSQNEMEVDLAKNSAHPMFFGANVAPEIIAQVQELMNPKMVYKAPSYYDSDKKQLCKKAFGAVVSKETVGCAEVLCELGHPIYGEFGDAFANRLPESVYRNLCAGAIH